MKTTWVLALAAAAALPACGGRTESADGDGDTDADGDGSPAAEPITFRLHLVSDVPETLYVDVTDASRPTGGHFLAILRGDEPIRKGDECASCPCDDCWCAICGAPEPTVAELSTGGSVEWVWDGLERAAGTCDDGSAGRCEDEAPAPAGEYVARFCWSATVVGTPPAPAEIEGETCADEPFTIPEPDGLVEHMIDNRG